MRNLAGGNYPSLILHNEFLIDWIRDRVSQHEWWAIQLLSTHAGGELTTRLNWQLLAVELEYALEYYIQNGYAIDFTDLQTYILDFVDSRPGTRLADHIRDVLQRLQPEMLEAYPLVQR